MTDSAYCLSVSNPMIVSIKIEYCKKFILFTLPQIILIM